VVGSPIPVYTVMSAESMEIPPGNYPFVIYRWEKQGMLEDVALQPVTNEPILTERFFEFLRSAKAASTSGMDLPEQVAFEALDAHHQRLWLKCVEEHRSLTQLRARHRIESLKSSHQARLSLLKDQLAQATDTRIQRMRAAQIASAQRDFGERLRRLEAASGRA